MIKELTSENFEEVANSEAGLFIIQFYSDTCMPCKAMEPVIELLDSNNEVNIYKVNTMESPDLAEHFAIMGVPNIVYCEKREIRYRFTGTTSLPDLQFVIDNIDDAYLKEHGVFKKVETKQDYFYIGIILFLVLLFSYLFFLN